MRLLATFVATGLLLAAIGCGSSSHGPTTIHSPAELKEALAKMSPGERAEYWAKARVAQEIITAEGGKQGPETRSRPTHTGPRHRVPIYEQRNLSKLLPRQRKALRKLLREAKKPPCTKRKMLRIMRKANATDSSQSATWVACRPASP